ncbi:NUDIX hydrolase [Moraxella cuniculi]|uniref:Putative NUDIX hydrolase n=1 Tax=Moraxella cuniculi TaxID=34061 RepID=A0A448GUM1_9GAMM|nr:CoA pyrophosphatase [Moraxella cuniculi]VEG12419.1 putative NUDIX hydrolase [Moraxella cuniculi]
MSYQDKIFLNPPRTYRTPLLARLAANLRAYQGVDELPRLGGMPDRVYHQPKPHASVLIVITNEPTPRLLLTKRSSRLTSHAGEIAFVGGHRDDMDTSTADTALREGFEEVGLIADGVSVIGYLPMQQSKSGLWVRPVVALIEPEMAMELVGQEAEIARIFWVELAYFSDTPTGIYQFDYTHAHQVATISTPAWYVDGETVWGLTGRMIANLLNIGFGTNIEWYYRQEII